MDYSAIPHDPDHPVGASPWASSPDQARPIGVFPNVDQVPDDAAQQSPTRTSAPTSSTIIGNPDVPSLAIPKQLNDHESNDQSPFESQPPLAQPPSSLQQPRPGQFVPPATRSSESRNAASARHHNTGPQQGQQPQTLYRMIAKITTIERTGKKDSILRFDVQTNLPKFRTTQFRDIRRTHSEFVKFQEHLIASNPEAIVPTVPAPVTSAGAGTEEDEGRIKLAMQKWLNVVCSNDVLMRDEEMIYFVESDFGYSPVVQRKQPATGARRKYLKQFAPPPDDTPELLEARPVVKAFYLATMEASQKIDSVVKSRRALGLAESDLGAKMQQMQVQEPHPGLGNAYRRLGKVIQTVGDYHAAQGTAEATTMTDALQFHSADALIVKETLTNRHILLREQIQAQQASRSRTQAADRLKASSSVRRDKVDEAIAALEEASAYEAHLTQKCTAVTSNLVREQRRWRARTAADLLASIREYVGRQIEAERRTLATLEQVRPDVRNIDASGGLSRLGREAHPVSARRSNLASSQGPKGDAWSGVTRRTDGVARSVSGSVSALGPGLAGADEGNAEGGAGLRARAGSRARAVEDDDEDRVDARNAASRLAQTTF